MEDPRAISGLRRIPPERFRAIWSPAPKPDLLQTALDGHRRTGPEPCIFPAERFS
jgi:hypothetical protein